MSLDITHRTTEGCDYGSSVVTESLSWFLERRSPTLAGLIELLVEQGILSIEAVYEKFKTDDDHELISNDEEAGSAP